VTVAAVTEVSICNLALTGLGRDVITAFNGANTEETVSALYYPIARDGLLEQAPWTFAEGRVANLAITLPAPSWGFRNAFQKPTQALKVWEIQGVGIKWKVVKDQIWCDLDTISVVYTEKLEDPTQFSPMFVIALGKWLEALMAVPLTGKVDRQKQALGEAQFWLGEAASSDGQQGTPNVPIADDLNVVRF